MKFLSFLFLFLSFHSFAETDFDKAVRLFNQKKYEQAEKLFKEIVKQNPTDYKAIEYLGDCAGFQADWDEAVGYYSKLKTKFPKNAEYWYKYGGALGYKIKNGNKFKALAYLDDISDAFKKSIELDPNHIDARWALVTYYIELPGFVGGSESKARKYANQLLKVSPVDGYLANGYIDEYFGRLTKAENYYKKAFEIGHSKTTFLKLYNLYLNKIKNPEIAKRLKEDFEK